MSWNKSFDAPRSLEILGIVSEACCNLGGPVSQYLHSLVVAKDYPTLVNYTIDYTGLSTNDAVYARQILALYQKNDSVPIPDQRELNAARRFVQSEAMCLITNTRLKCHARRPHLVDSTVHRVLFTAQRKIADILGQVPSLEDLKFAFGPGANTNVKGALACPRAKLGAPLECSNDFIPNVGEFLSEFPHWAALHGIESQDSYVTDVCVAPGKVMFVPKNAKTHRSIVVEPILNSFAQKGVGSYMKDRLLRFGVDLYDQSINQQRAHLGSINGSLATIDLSMASDCLAKELVHTLLPYDWAEFLSSLRTSVVTLPTSVDRSVAEEFGMGYMSRPPHLHTLEKFSSMGNGFTFELESLVFYGLCFGVLDLLGLHRELISVYGDDLIVPTEAASLLTEVLDYCGFTVNSDKSFVSGPFRESCGADYLNGFDIRPFYQKTLVSERTLFSMHNWFIRAGEMKLADTVRRLCNPVYVITGPDGYGDGHLIGDFPVRQSRKLRRLGWEGSVFDTYILKSRFYKKPLPGDALIPVYSVYTRSGEKSATDPDIVRGSSGYAKISIYTLARSIFSRNA